jgi:hypothetical protein
MSTDNTTSLLGSTEQWLMSTDNKTSLLGSTEQWLMSTDNKTSLLRSTEQARYCKQENVTSKFIKGMEFIDQVGD